MGSENETYEVEFTEECIEEIRNIYEYISNKLFAKESAKKLIGLTKQHILSLKNFPNKYVKIEKFDNLKREYRRMIIKNYVVLYTIDEKHKKIYISHMYYGRMKYL